MNLMRRLLIPVFLVATATAAFAQPAQPAPSAAPTAGDMAAQDCARARKAHKACVLTFSTGDTVDGKVPTGDGTTVTALQHGKMPSLIHVREDFRAEIIKSAEDID
jgi:hypothetical protein